MATVREAFLSRVRSLMEVLNQSCNFDDGNIDNMLTRGNLLYHHAVRLASVNIVEDATIAKLRAVVDLLSEVDESKQNLCFQPEVEYTGAQGRPKICVTKDQLSYLAELQNLPDTQNFLSTLVFRIICLLTLGFESSHCHLD